MEKSRKMRVVFLAGDPFPAQRFGVSEHVFQLTKALGVAGVDIHIISLSNTNNTENENINVGFHRIPKRIIYYVDPASVIARIVKIVDSIHPDIVHIQGSSPPYAWAAIYLSRKYPIVATIHGDIETEAELKGFFDRIWMKLIYLPLYDNLLSHVKEVFVVSKDLKRRLESHYGNVCVISNGIDIENTQYMKGENKVFSYILYLGALSTIKGVDILFNALLEINKKFGPLKTIIAGNGPESRNLQQLVNSSPLVNSITFTGFVQGSEKRKLIQDASIMVIPSRQEGVPIVLLEALALGKAIIASNVGGIPDILTDNENGLLFDSENYFALAERIMSLVKNPKERDRLCEKGIETISKFSWKNIAQHYKDEYEKVINNVDLNN